MRRIVALLVASGAIAVSAASAQIVPAGESPVGAVTRRLIPQGAYNWRGASTRALVTTVWYPAIAGTAMAEHVIGPADSPLFRLGKWAVNAQPAPGRFPLIVLSHGTGGSAQIMAWLARGLASWGYVVAGVNHPGNNSLEDYTAEGFLLWWERARDLTTAIDLLLQDPMLGPIIDQKRVGAAGFSLGGYTMFEITGGRTDPALFQKFCRSDLAEGCVAPPEFPDLLARWTQLESTSEEFRNAVQQAGRSLRDPRIRAAFAIAPALGPAFIPDSLGEITVPVAIVAGMDDRIAPVGPNARALARLTPRATLSLLPGVGHYTFLASCTDFGVQAQPQLCAEAAGVNRDVIHQRTIDAAKRFFEGTLQQPRTVASHRWARPSLFGNGRIESRWLTPQTTIGLSTSPQGPRLQRGGQADSLRQAPQAPILFRPPQT